MHITAKGTPITSHKQTLEVYMYLYEIYLANEGDIFHK